MKQPVVNLTGYVFTITPPCAWDIDGKDEKRLVEMLSKHEDYEDFQGPQPSYEWLAMFYAVRPVAEIQAFVSECVEKINRTARRRPGSAFQRRAG